MADIFRTYHDTQEPLRFSLQFRTSPTTTAAADLTGQTPYLSIRAKDAGANLSLFNSFDVSSFVVGPLTEGNIDVVLTQAQSDQLVPGDPAADYHFAGQILLIDGATARQTFPSDDLIGTDAFTIKVARSFAS